MLHDGDGVADSSERRKREARLGLGSLFHVLDEREEHPFLFHHVAGELVRQAFESRMDLGQLRTLDAVLARDLRRQFANVWDFPTDVLVVRRLYMRDEVAKILVHAVALRGAGVNRVADGGAAEADGVLHRAGDGALGRMALAQGIAIVQLEDQRNLAGTLSRDGLDEPERGGVGVAP